jgi:hypothetical protein
MTVNGNETIRFIPNRNGKSEDSQVMLVHNESGRGGGRDLSELVEIDN